MMSPMVVSSRCFHSFSMTVSWARFWLVPTRGLVPVTFCTYSTDGSFIRYFTARSVTARVRSSVVPSGISSSTVKYPWSSAGRKLVGVSL